MSKSEVEQRHHDYELPRDETITSSLKSGTCLNDNLPIGKPQENRSCSKQTTTRRMKLPCAISSIRNESKNDASALQHEEDIVASSSSASIIRQNEESESKASKSNSKRLSLKRKRASSYNKDVEPTLSALNDPPLFGFAALLAAGAHLRDEATKLEPRTGDKNCIGHIIEQGYEDEQSVICEDDIESTSVTSTGTDDCDDCDEGLSKNEEKWFDCLEALRSYKELNGNCIVPRGYTENPRLATWVAVQRKQYRRMLNKKQSAMTQARVDLLNCLDFAWNAQEEAWGRHFIHFQSFRAEFGHGDVPVDYAKYPKLHLWVREQRRHYTLMQQNRKTHMTNSRVLQLTDAGFCWDTCDAQWSVRLQELVKFHQEFGHCVVPANYTKSPKLAYWVGNQRRLYKRVMAGKTGKMPGKRIRALEDIGFVWSPRDK